MSDTPRNDAHQLGVPDPVEGRWLNDRELRLMLERECNTWKEAAKAREGAEAKLRDVRSYAGNLSSALGELQHMLAKQLMGKGGGVQCAACGKYAEHEAHEDSCPVNIGLAIIEDALALRNISESQAIDSAKAKAEGFQRIPQCVPEINREVWFARKEGVDWENWPEASQPHRPDPNDAPFVTCPKHNYCATWRGVHFYSIRFGGGDSPWVWDAINGWCFSRTQSGKKCETCGGKGTIGIMYADEPDYREPCPDCHQVGKERTDADYAIEFGGYLATAATRLMDAQNAVDALEELEPSAPARLRNDNYDIDVEEAHAARSEAWSGLRTAVYEFEKRRDRASRTVADTKQGETP